jgi:ribonuclease P protein component
MLPPINRLRHPEDSATVYRRGSRCHGAHLTLRALSVKGTEEVQTLMPTRFGISISQKVSKRAVVRNRVKRQIRAALRQMLPRILSGWCVVIVVRPTAVGCNYDEFLRELEQLLVEAEVLDGNSRRGLL